MGVNAHNITVDFERALCEYTGAPFAVATTSCTMALLLAVAWEFRLDTRLRGHLIKEQIRPEVQIPKCTYVSVPMSIMHAGGCPVFRDEQWSGEYQLKPLPVWDAARRFTSGMYVPGRMQCVSFHAAKILGDTQGGAILHDNADADAWLRRARFDGRTPGVAPKEDTFDMIGWHAYLSPDVAARLLFHLSVLPKHNADLPWDEYPDLSTWRIFQ